jgi:hypothetical protein
MTNGQMDFFSRVLSEEYPAVAHALASEHHGHRNDDLLDSRSLLIRHHVNVMSSSYSDCKHFQQSIWPTISIRICN